MWRAVWSKSFATILPIHHNHYSLQTRHIKNQIHFFSTSLQFKYNVDTLQPIHPPNYSPPTNSSRQYHNQQNYHSIRLDSNLPDLLSPYTVNRMKSTIHILHCHQPLHLAAVVHGAQLGQAVQTNQILQTVRVPSSLFLSIVAPLKAKFTSLGTTVSHSVSNRTLPSRTSPSGPTFLSVRQSIALLSPESFLRQHTIVDRPRNISKFPRKIALHKQSPPSSFINNCFYISS